ncbi:MAG: response regulator [bacterium]
MSPTPLKLLLIDDNQDHANILQYAFQKSKRCAQLRSFDDSVSAIDFLLPVKKKETEYPDLILLDLNMPRIDGRELLKILKSNDQTKGIPIIVLSSSEREDDIRYAYEQGACSYISKSTLLSDFSSVFPMFMEYWIGIALLPNRRDLHDE